MTESADTTMEQQSGEAAPAPAVKPSGRPAAWKAPVKTIVWAILWCILTGAIGLGVALLFAVALKYFGLPQPIDGPNMIAVTLIVSSLIDFALLIAVALWRARKEDGLDLWAEFLRAPLRQRWLIWLSVPLLTAFSWSLSGTDWEPYPDLAQYLPQVHPLLLVLGAVIVGLQGPLAEELFFRGWMWTALRRRWGPLATSLATGTLWLAMHFGHGATYILLLVPSAVALSLIRHRCGSVRATAIAHICYNGVETAGALASAFLGF